MGQWMDEREGCKFHLYVTQVEVGAWVLGWREVGEKGLGNKFGAWEQGWELWSKDGNFRTKVG